MSSIIDVKRKKGETFDAMFRRFSRRLQQSGKALDVRAGRFFAKKPNGTKILDSALRRLEIRDRREYLLKTGKATEEDFRKPRRK